MSEIEKIMNLVMEDAAERLNDAANAGRHDDGGASVLSDQVKFYKLGMNGSIPKEWEKYSKKLDPEYQEYLRLKNKFK